MLIDIEASPQFYLPFTLAQIELMIKCSTHHYDATCRAASAPPVYPPPDQTNGMLSSWRRKAEFYMEHPVEDGIKPIKTLATWGQLDLLLKIMENTYCLPDSDHKTIRQLSDDVRSALNAARAALDSWKLQIDTSKKDAS